MRHGFGLRVAALKGEIRTAPAFRFESEKFETRITYFEIRQMIEGPEA
jgi:hypothetical protein